MTTTIAAPVMPRSVRFRAEREPVWRELEELVARSERRGLRSLDAKARARLPVLYRAALASLAVARETVLDQALLTYLEGLCARAHVVLHSPADGFLRTLGRIVARDLPQAFRRALGFVLGAALLFALGAAIGWLLVRADHAWFDVLVPDWLEGGRGPEDRASLLASLYQERPVQLGDLALLATFVVQNNVLIAIAAFAGGAALALPTMIGLVVNGTVIGAFAAIHAEQKLLLPFLAWLSVHGTIELLAICLAAAAGIKLAAAILYPGMRRLRREALAAEGRDATVLLIGAGLLLLVSGLLEGFVRQLVQDDALRAAIGGGTLALVVVWLLLAGRRSRF